MTELAVAVSEQAYAAAYFAKMHNRGIAQQSMDDCRGFFAAYYPDFSYMHVGHTICGGAGVRRDLEFADHLAQKVLGKQHAVWYAERLSKSREGTETFLAVCDYEPTTSLSRKLAILHAEWSYAGGKGAQITDMRITSLAAFKNRFLLISKQPIPPSDKYADDISYFMGTMNVLAWPKRKEIFVPVAEALKLAKVPA